MVISIYRDYLNMLLDLAIDVPVCYATRSGSIFHIYIRKPVWSCSEASLQCYPNPAWILTS